MPLKKIVKKSKAKSPKKIKKTKQKIKVIKLWDIYKQSWIEISSFWRYLLGILFIYAVLNFIFLSSFSLLPSSESLQSEIESYIGQDAGRALSSITLVGISVFNFSSPANSTVQGVLFLIASSAFIWTLRKLRGLKKVSMRQAYYEGPANFIPLILVLVMLLLTMIPASVASAILMFALPIVGSGLEKLVIYSICLPLILLTIYWLLVWWPAFYISMLPGTRPVIAMRAAADLTRYVRTKILFRLLGIIFTLIALFLAVAIPASLIWQRIVPITVYSAMFILFGLMHIMTFTLYRSLVDERQSQKSNP